jgi:ferric-dicitrate binding protein FerR (iron transport regulator)
MKETPYRIAYLIAGYIRNTLSVQEQDELDNWVNETDENLRLFEDLTDEDNINANLAWMDQVQTEQSFQALKEKGAFEIRKKKFMIPPVWLAAASVVLVIGLFFLIRKTQHTSSGQLVARDTTLLQPGGNRATLTLEDGKIIDLSKTVNGQIAQVKGSHVRKPADGELEYEKEDSGNRMPSMHTLSTPVGGQYQLQLPDGTKVWLNAASKLTYPTAFIEAERSVYLSGEAYFEVAKKDGQSFKVQLDNGSVVQVLGTQFNVTSYADETTQEITLLEGKVAVVNKNQTASLMPGQQALINEGKLSTKERVDTERIIAWKNGFFEFHDAHIETIMKQVERWYGATIIYEGKLNQQFNATILRKEPLTKLLHLLDLTGQVQFKIDNKTIYVLPR